MMQYVALFVLVASCNAGPALHPLSDEFIEKINSMATTWKAGRNFGEKTPLQHIRRLMGVLPSAENTLLSLRRRARPAVDFEVPENFDSRTQWPECESLREIRDQGSCGSCWAISSVAVMTDRTCINSGGELNIHYSTEDLMSCCNFCGEGCNGGWPAMAFRYWANRGIVSGGLHGSNEGCKPYSIPPCAHHVKSDRPECNGTLPTPECRRQCQPNYDVDYSNDLHYSSDVYKVDDDEAMVELVERGPLVGAFDVYEDFLQYKSGVYQHTYGSSLGGHAIKIIGYGVEDGVKYWLCANSWNSDWGDNGYFKILRGSNECGIEGSIFTGMPSL